MTTYPSEEDLDELQAYADKGPAVSRATCGRVVEALRKRIGPRSFLPDPWRIEVKEVTPAEEDPLEIVLKGRTIGAPGPGHFELRVWWQGSLVFFMSTDPGAEVSDIPDVSTGVHMFVALVDQEHPLDRFLKDANRARNAGI